MSNVHGIPADKFYRLVFPRGRFFKEIEDDLTVFVQLIDECAGVDYESFKISFNTKYGKFHTSADKTIDNHRTEVIRLFGLTVTDNQGLVRMSGNSSTLLRSQDFPLFFKAFCNKFQFPNYINKRNKIQEQLDLGIRNFKPAAFILELLRLADEQSQGAVFSVSGAEISNLVFNDLRVAKGERKPAEVLETLLSARKTGYRYPGGSNEAQHGREFLRFMVLAKLLKTDDAGSEFSLNKSEPKAADYILQKEYSVDFPDSIENDEDANIAAAAWEKVFKNIHEEEIAVFRTIPSETIIKAEDTVRVSDEVKAGLRPPKVATKEIGDEGELYVLAREKELVANIRPDKVALVQRVSNDTSLGYDIQSLEVPDCSSKKYIEVKSTVRTFPPSEQVLTFFRMSGNEWETARQHGEYYYIYRVVMLSDKVTLHIVKNPIAKAAENKIILEVIDYRVILKHEAVDDVYSIVR